MDLGLRPNVLCCQDNVSLCLCNRFSKATPTISRKYGTTLFLQLKHGLSEYVPSSGTRGLLLKWSCWAASRMQVRLIWEICLRFGQVAMLNMIGSLSVGQRGQESSIQPLLPLAEKAQCPPCRRGRHTRPTSETPPCLRTLMMVKALFIKLINICASELPCRIFRQWHLLSKGSFV